MKNIRILIILPVVMLISIAGFQGFSGKAGAKDKLPTVLLPVKDSPLVTFRIQFRAGSINDPEGKKGITALTAQMITDGGTKKKTYKEIIDRFYPMASGVGVRVDKEVTTVISTVHNDNLAEFYPLMREMLLEPGFREEDFERIRTNQINYLEKHLRGNDDEELGKEALNMFLYDGHPYGCPVEGLIEDLKSISLEDVKKHYAQIFTCDNVTVGLAGGYDDKLLQTVISDLTALPSRSTRKIAVSRFEPIHGIEVMAVEKECRSTAISIGFPIAVTRSDEDYYPLMIANSYLGEHRTFNGVLMIRMRELRGLNYGDYSYIENFIQDGGSTFPVPNIPRRQQHFSIWIRPVQHDNRHFALRQAIRELEKLVTNGLDKDELELTKKFLKNYSKLWAQSQDRRLGYLMDSRFYRTGDIIETLPSKLDKITLEDVNRAIKKHLDFNNLKVAIVTKGARQFLDEMIANKPSPITYGTPSISGEILDEDKKIEGYCLKINKKKSKVVNAEDLFEK